MSGLPRFAEEIKKSSALFKNPREKDPLRMWVIIRAEISQKTYRTGIIRDVLEKCVTFLPDLRPLP